MSDVFDTDSCSKRWVHVSDDILEDNNTLHYMPNNCNKHILKNIAVSQIYTDCT